MRMESFSFCAFSLSISWLLTYRSPPQPTPHQRVHERTEEDTEGSKGGTHGHLVAQEEDGDESLHAGLGSSRDVVRERRRQTNLSNRHDADEESEDSSQVHNEPEEGGRESARVLPESITLENDDEGNEEDDTIRIVLKVIGRKQNNVKAQLPAIVINDRNHLLRIDTVERNEEGRHDTENGANQRKVDLSFRSNEKAENNDQAAQNHLERCADMEEEITTGNDNPVDARENHVKHNGQRPSD